MNETRRAVLEAIVDGPVAGTTLAQRLDVSRTAIWKHVEGLREAGFEIESSEVGYDLSSIPEFGGPAVEFGLRAPFSVEYHDSIESTNARARALAADGAEDVVVLADEQTGGRGRLERPWISPTGGAWFSILVRPALPPAEVPLLTLAAGVAVVRAVASIGVDARLKWPNDVLVPVNDGSGAEMKLAGILTEMAGEADRTAWVVVGIGLNANVDPDALPDDGASLREIVGTVNRREVVQYVLDAFDYLRTDPASVLPAWRRVSSTLGRRVRVSTSSCDVTGVATDVEFPGRLVVETDDGPIRVHAGDCEHLRPL